LLCEVGGFAFDEPESDDDCARCGSEQHIVSLTAPRREPMILSLTWSRCLGNISLRTSMEPCAVALMTAEFLDFAGPQLLCN
jgi:hypothetical protein